MTREQCVVVLQRAAEGGWFDKVWKDHAYGDLAPYHVMDKARELLPDAANLEIKATMDSISSDGTTATFSISVTDRKPALKLTIVREPK